MHLAKTFQKTWKKTCVDFFLPCESIRVSGSCFSTFLYPVLKTNDNPSVSICVFNVWKWIHKSKGIPSRKLIHPPKMAYLKIIFLFPRWDMLIPWRVLVQSTNFWYPWNPIIWVPPRFAVCHSDNVEGAKILVDAGAGSWACNTCWWTKSCSNLYKRYTGTPINSSVSSFSWVPSGFPLFFAKKPLDMALFSHQP